MKNEATFKVAGRVASIGETQTFASGFAKREIIVEASANESYKNPVALTLKKDDVAKADSLSVGDGVEVEGFIDGREWNGPNGVRHFIDLTVRSLMMTDKTAKPTTAGSFADLISLAGAYGVAEDEVRKMCAEFVAANRIKDRKATGGKMLPGEFQEIADKIIEADNGGGDSDIPDDMPF